MTEEQIIEEINEAIKKANETYPIFKEINTIIIKELEND